MKLHIKDEKEQEVVSFSVKRKHVANSIEPLIIVKFPQTVSAVYFLLTYNEQPPIFRKGLGREEFEDYLNTLDLLGAIDEDLITKLIRGVVINKMPLLLEVLKERFEYQTNKELRNMVLSIFDGEELLLEDIFGPQEIVDIFKEDYKIRDIYTGEGPRAPNNAFLEPWIEDIVYHRVINLLSDDIIRRDVIIDHHKSASTSFVIRKGDGKILYHVLLITAYTDDEIEHDRFVRRILEMDDWRPIYEYVFDLWDPDYITVP